MRKIIAAIAVLSVVSAHVANASWIPDVRTGGQTMVYVPDRWGDCQHFKLMGSTDSGYCWSGSKEPPAARISRGWQLDHSSIWHYSDRK